MEERYVFYVTVKHSLAIDVNTTINEVNSVKVQNGLRRANPLDEIN